jgi:hypothetical protein
MDISEYEYKTDVSYSYFYSDICSIQLKLYIVKFTYINKILLLSSSLTKVHYHNPELPWVPKTTKERG